MRAPTTQGYNGGKALTPELDAWAASNGTIVLDRPGARTAAAAVHQRPRVPVAVLLHCRNPPC